MKKVVCILMALLTIVGGFSFAFAEESSTGADTASVQESATVGLEVPTEKEVDEEQTAVKSFKDVLPNGWYVKYIDLLIAKDYTIGMGDGTYGIGRNVTNAEILTFMLRVINQTPTDLTYDIEKGEQWYSPYYKKAVEIGLLEENDEAKANENAMRIEVAILMVRALKSSDIDFEFENKLELPEEFPIYFTTLNMLGKGTRYYKDYTVYDLDEAPFQANYSGEWFGALHYMYNRGLMQGDDNNKSNPKEYITREETATMLARVIDKEYREWCAPYINEDELFTPTEEVEYGILKMPTMPEKMTSEMRERQFSYDISPEIDDYNGEMFDGYYERDLYYGAYDTFDAMWEDQVITIEGDLKIYSLGTPNMRIAYEYEISGWKYPEKATGGALSVEDATDHLSQIFPLMNMEKSEYKVIEDSPLPYSSAVIGQMNYRYTMYFRTTDLASCKLNENITKENTWYEVIFDVKTQNKHRKGYYPVAAIEVQFADEAENSANSGDSTAVVEANN